MRYKVAVWDNKIPGNTQWGIRDTVNDQWVYLTGLNHSNNYTAIEIQCNNMNDQEAVRGGERVDEYHTEIDVRITLGLTDRQEVLDKLQTALESIPELSSAFELINDGFGHLVPDDRPIA